MFCGWLCAFGALGDLHGAVARILRIPQISRSAKLDPALAGATKRLFFEFPAYIIEPYQMKFRGNGRWARLSKRSPS